MAASRSTPTTSASSKSSGGDDRVALTLREFSTLPVERLKGIGPKREKAFADLGITTVLDLLTHYPRRYIDRTKEATIAELRPGEEGMVLATVDKVSARMTRTKKRMVTVTVRDHTGKLDLHVLQPAVARTSTDAGYRSHLLRQARRVQGLGTDDQPRRRSGRQQDGSHHRGVSPIGEGRPEYVGDR